MRSDDLPAILGGGPLSERPLHIVRPTFPRLESFADRFQATLTSGAVTNQGAYVREFETALARHMGVPGVVACNNGQSALLVMLRAAGIDAGEVIVPSYTFSATPHAVRWCGATPVFADCDERTLCIDPADAERRITPRTRALLPVDVYGIACDYAALDAIGKRHGIKILYDSAPSFGTRVGARTGGGFGDAQSFSFHATKAFTTMEGGCVASRDEQLLCRAAELRNFGQSRGADCDEPGINGKMTEVCALIGLEQLPGFEVAIRRRAEVAARYRRGLAKLAGLRLAEPPADQEPVWLYFPVIIAKAEFGLDRAEVVRALVAENLYVRKYYEIPCHHLAAYAGAAHLSLPRSEAAAYNVVALPVYNDMTDDEADRFIRAFERIHRHARQVAEAVAKGPA